MASRISFAWGPSQATCPGRGPGSGALPGAQAQYEHLTAGESRIQPALRTQAVGISVPTAV